MPKPKVGFAVICPSCGAAEELKVLVHNLEIECGSCGEEISRDQICEATNEAIRLLRWLEAADAIKKTSSD